MQLTSAAVTQAAKRIAADVVRTPLARSATLSDNVGAEVFVKFENQQFTGSFKDRGAANHLRSLRPEVAAAGVIALSAGNHAQGVAHHAGRLGIPATIVMPTSAPFNKVLNTRKLGADVVQHGTTFAEAREKLLELQTDRGLAYVSPYDDRAVIAGQGTVAVEMLADQPELEVLVVPVGGGGLVSGMAVAAKATKPSIEIIGVEVESYVATASGRAAGSGQPARGTGFDTVADGIAVKSLGELTAPLIDEFVDDMVVVKESTTEEAIVAYLEIEKTVAEGAGAVALAAVMADPGRFAGKKVGVVLSGGNIDTRVLASVLMRGLVAADRISTLRIELGDLPGQLAPVISVVAAAGANIVEIDHRRVFDPISARSAKIDLVIETRDGQQRRTVVDALDRLGVRAEVVAGVDAQRRPR